MFDILFYLVENFFQNGGLPDNETISQKLSDAGFEDEDISELLTWLRGFDANHQMLVSSDALKTNSAIRVYSSEEINSISVKARGFLTFLTDSEVITAPQRETIIDRVVALSESQVGVDEIKLIVLLALWNQQGSIDSVTVELLAARDETALQ